VFPASEVLEEDVPDPEQATRSSDAVTRATPEKIFDFFIIPPISILNVFQDKESIQEDAIDCNSQTLTKRWLLRRSVPDFGA
jgi:hypothetical protein